MLIQVIQMKLQRDKCIRNVDSNANLIMFLALILGRISAIM